MQKNSHILPSNVWPHLARDYRDAFHMLPLVCDAQGRLDAPARAGLHIKEFTRPSMNHIRGHALNESVRWGESYVFFLLPGIISWIVPLVRDQDIVGGIIGGHVVPDRDPYNLMECVNQLTFYGCRRKTAEKLVHDLPVWPHDKINRAARWLFDEFYRRSAWAPARLNRNRVQALQQRQIAEEIHEQKKGRGRDTTPVDKERILLSLMKAGDQKNARRELNKMLGTMFSLSPNLNILRARVIEMMGYLVRTAVEDNPELTSLIEENHARMATLIDTRDFEELAAAVRHALDSFMHNIYLTGRSRSNPAVWKIYNYLDEHFREPLALADVAEYAGLSTYRVSHLFKETTGQSVFQYVLRLRVKEAQRLLERTGMSCTEIAYETGFTDQSYFIKQFRRLMGITPARYRRLYHSGAAA